MGNCCGKADGNFEGEGRVLGGTDNVPARRPLGTMPNQRKTRLHDEMLGGGADSGPRLAPGEAAAKAAEARAKAQGGTKGVLGQKLNMQKQQSQNAVLAEGARENLAAREADAAAQMRTFN